MNEQTHAFAVETTAEIEVLRHAVVALMADALRRLEPPVRTEVLADFLASANEVPPGAPFPTPEATRLFEGIAEAIPRHAERFANDVRAALE